MYLSTGFTHSPLRAAPKVSDTLLDSQLDKQMINDDVVECKCEDDLSHLDAPHQHQRGGGSEELPVDEAGDQEETHRYSAGNPTAPSVGENMKQFL